MNARTYLKRIAPLLIFAAIWLAWYGWYRLTTNVVVYEEHYANGKVSVRGLVKRQPDGSYKRHGLWSEFHTNGRMKLQRTYIDGVAQHDDQWWDERGRRLGAASQAT